MRRAERLTNSSEIIGTSRSAWPRPITSCAREMHVPPPSNRAAVQAALEVSKASNMLEVMMAPCRPMPQARKLNGFDRLHFGNIVADQALDAALQSDCGRGA